MIIVKQTYLFWIGLGLSSFYFVHHSLQGNSMLWIFEKIKVRCSILHFNNCLQHSLLLLQLITLILLYVELYIVQQHIRLGQDLLCLILLVFIITAKPVYNGHTWEMARWPLYTGWPLNAGQLCRNIRQLKILGKLSGDRIIQSDRYIKGRYIQVWLYYNCAL